MIRAVNSNDIDLVWATIKPWIDDAMEYTDLINSDDVLEAIRDKRMQCMVTGDPVCGVVVTEIAPYPRKTVLRVVALGGSQFSEWVGELNDMLGEWAKDIDAKLESSGRDGWVKRLAPLGWKKASVTVERIV